MSIFEAKGSFGKVVYGPLFGDDRLPDAALKVGILGSLEVQVLRYGSPYVPEFFGFTVDDLGQKAVIMERVPRQCTKSMIQLNPLIFLRDIFSALVDVNRRCMPYEGIVHRDLKLQNIGYGAGGKIKIYDWGLSVPIISDGLEVKAYKLAGTLPYAPPEAFIEGYITTSKFDSWSIGVMVFQAISDEVFPISYAQTVDGRIKCKKMFRHLAASISMPDSTIATYFSKRVNTLKHKFHTHVEVLEIVSQLLQINPDHRLDLNEALLKVEECLSRRGVYRLFNSHIHDMGFESTSDDLLHSSDFE